LIERFIFGDSKFVIRRKNRNIIIFIPHGKWCSKITSPIKPPKGLTMTHEENEEMHNQLSRLKNQINELNDGSVKKSIFINVKIEME
jgi:hypothetical protein